LEAYSGIADPSRRALGSRVVALDRLMVAKLEQMVFMTIFMTNAVLTGSRSFAAKKLSY
jgi:hypothetical protein